jgi:hypothetical protein
MKLLGAALGAAVLASAGAAHAGLISIGLVEAGVGGGGLYTLATGASTASATNVAYGAYTINNVNASGTTAFGGLSSTTFDVSGGSAATLQIFVSEQGVTGPVNLASYQSLLTVVAVPAGWTLKETTWLDPGNGRYAGTSFLATDTFVSPGTKNVDSSLSVGSGPYSLTEIYTITSIAGGGTAQGSINLSALPEPGALSLVGLGLIGIAVLRRRVSWVRF